MARESQELGMPLTRLLHDGPFEGLCVMNIVGNGFHSILWSHAEAVDVQTAIANGSSVGEYANTDPQLVSL